jgi:uncharacterized protein (DUF2164 family)
VKIELNEQKRRQLKRAIQEHFVDRHDETIGDLKAELLLDFFIAQLGPSVYNQAIQDATRFMQEKLVDLEGEYYAIDGTNR